MDWRYLASSYHTAMASGFWDGFGQWIGEVLFLGAIGFPLLIALAIIWVTQSGPDVWDKSWHIRLLILSFAEAFWMRPVW